MGTVAGVRTRKYHAFYAGIAGRGESVYLADFELELNGRSLWPHRYASSGEPVVHPDPLSAATAFAYEPFKGFPCWRWELSDGKLAFWIEPASTESHRGGIHFFWKWQPAARNAGPAQLKVRPFWAMRELHGMGGKEWSARSETAGGATVSSISAGDRSAIVRLEGAWAWQDSPQWYERFFYSEEAARGYDSEERLFSAGTWSVDVSRARKGLVSWLVSEEREERSASTRTRGKARPAALDFVLREPAGICAGFPWFGEWGRDTFISLPGIVVSWAGWANSASAPTGASGELHRWSFDVLTRWADWIRSAGMIPNLIDRDGTPQWESSDGTLWWCHAVAALWAFGLDKSFESIGHGLRESFNEPLWAAIASIRSGRHRGLRPGEDGLLEVTEPHSTWMDARVDGKAVTPRLGKLPEINALWFQARCLQWIWSERGSSLAQSGSGEIEALGRAVLRQCREPDRPNEIFLHSLPLAPSFVLRETRGTSEQLSRLAAQLWTPVGLRTLSPVSPAYRPRCVGDPRTRDQAYHQGPPWAWLGGHYQMARARVVRKSQLPEMHIDPQAPDSGPISRHVAEIFDAEPPFTPRGAPAQAWSIACLEEAAARRKLRIDAQITGVLAQRWLAHLGQQL